MTMIPEQDNLLHQAPADSLFEKNADACEIMESDRRGFLKAGLISAAALGFWLPVLGNAEAAVTKGTRARVVQLDNAHTGDKFHGEYWVGGRYLPDAFGEIKSVMRDHRTGDRFPIDPRLMDILYVLQNRIGTTKAYEIFSGYRSPKTNAKLRRLTHGVAEHSLHMTGQAIDLKLPGTKLSSLRKAAIGLKSGGVGYYPSSDFVHIDTGRVRHW